MFKKKNNKLLTKILEEDVENEINIDDNFENRIKKIDNKIYFYSDITSKSILYLKELLHELHLELVTASIKYNFKPIIELRIQSNGGEVFAGLDAYNFILNFPVDIYTYVDGFLASSASFLYLAGKKRFIYENSYILIHQLSDYNWGSYSILEDEMKNNKKIMTKIINTYKKFTNIPKRKIEEILKNEMYLDCEECLKYGLSSDYCV